MARLRETLSQQTMATSSKGFALPGRKQPDFTPIAVRPTLREVPQSPCFRAGWPGHLRALKRAGGTPRRAVAGYFRRWLPTPQLWENPQKTYELRVAEIESGPHIRERVQRRESSQAVGGELGHE